MSLAPARSAPAGLLPASYSRLISKEFEIVAAIPDFEPIPAAEWPDASEVTEPGLLVSRKAKDSPLDDTDIFLIDAISRGEDLATIAKESDS